MKPGDGAQVLSGAEGDIATSFYTHLGPLRLASPSGIKESALALPHVVTS